MTTLQIICTVILNLLIINMVYRASKWRDRALDAERKLAEHEAEWDAHDEWTRR